MTGPRDKPPGVEDGDREIADDVQPPPAERPEPGETGGMLGEGGQGGGVRPEPRGGGMIGEG